MLADDDRLVVQGTSLTWYLNDGLVCRHTFDFKDDNQPISQALLAVFSDPSASKDPASPAPKHDDLSPSSARSNVPNKALVVVLKTLMHIIYVGGGSYCVHLPFPILKVWPVPLGLVLERQLDPEHSFHVDPDHQLPRLLTLSSPLEDFGMVRCNNSSLDPAEEILFISSENDALCVSRNVSEGRITLWYASPDQQARRKVFFLVTLLTIVENTHEKTLLGWSIHFQSRR